ncbi:MAG: hypothetical protein M1832_002609 [Thelocarpon impressellum]|nr:MAG: hypothetical protein M1832_002609 [Thelocarpon impressellum]
MPVHDAPADEDARQSYNVAPGYYEPVYRADVPDWGSGSQQRHAEDEDAQQGPDGGAPPSQVKSRDEQTEIRYKLQSMKWGLIPFWTKRNPDYGSMLKTINCRDDSLLENRGMWTTMKQKKRCIVLCQGFYEWLKKNNGKERIPHFTKRKDGKLMCFAGLWDCAQYEGSDEKLYTYTIITTSSNKQLQFLHDRMPVILDNGSDEMRTWLDPRRSSWSSELQSLLKPYQGELEIYSVRKEVGKVGNNSATFIIPVSSAENKNNIANFFGKSAKKGAKVEHVPSEQRETTEHSGTEDNAPLPMPGGVTKVPGSKKRGHEQVGDEVTDAPLPPPKVQKASELAPSPQNPPPTRMQSVTPKRATRSATSNASADGKAQGSPAKAADGNRRITAFFGTPSTR